MKRNRRYKNKQMELLEMKYISEVKNSADEINSRLNSTREKISEIEAHNN